MSETPATRHIPVEPPPTLRDIINMYCQGLDEETREALMRALTAREDTIADMLRMAGSNLGVSMPLAAFMLAETGLGTVPDSETYEMLHTQFHAEIDRLNEFFRQQGGG